MVYRFCQIYESKIYDDKPDWSLQEEFEDTKGAIRIGISKKNRQHNGQKKKNNKTKKDLQNTTQKTTDRATRTQSKIGSERRCPGRVSSFCCASGTRHVPLAAVDRKKTLSMIIGYVYGFQY
jgi:hypothetical protein